MSSPNPSPPPLPTAILEPTASDVPPADSPSDFSSLRRSTLAREKRNLTCARCFQDASDLGLNAKLKVCTRCKEVAYCSRQCQVSDWSVHKSSCGQTPFQTSTDIEVAHRLRPWRDVHNVNISQATYSAMCRSQPTDTIEGFDVGAHCMWYRISARDDHDGNPAKMFRVEAGKIRPREWMFEVENFNDTEKEFHEGEDSTVSQDQAFVLEDDGDDQGEDGGEGGTQVSRRTGSGQNAQWKGVRDSILASIPHHTAQYLDYLDPSMRESFIGIIPICYSVIIPDRYSLNFVGLCRISDDRVLLHGLPELIRFVSGSTMPPPRHEMWLERLKNRVELGHVFRLERSSWSSTLMAGLGEMRRKKEGGKFHWVPLTSEERRRHGYQHIVSGLSY